MKKRLDFLRKQFNFGMFLIFLVIMPSLNAGSCSSNNQIQAVLFEMDGVLVDTIALETAIFKQYLVQEFGIDATKDDERHTMGLTRREIWQYFKATYGLSQYVGSLYEAQRGHYRNALRKNGLKARDAALIGFLEYLKSNGIKIGVVTSNESETTGFILSSLGIREYFDVVITADDVKRGKPFPEPYMRASITLGIKPKNCLAIEDSKNGIQAAIDACMTAIAVRAPHSEKQDFGQADLIITSFDNFTCNNIERKQVEAQKDGL